MSGLTIDNVTVTYRNGHTALHNASFSIPQGSIAALVGINGSGKSTLFKSIMGFVPVSQGTVNIMGMAAKRALKQNIVAYVPQSEEIDWNFPVLVEDVVMMGRYGYMNMFRIPRAEDHQQVTSALERVNMVSYRKRQIGELSGGQRKRVFLARKHSPKKVKSFYSMSHLLGSMYKQKSKSWHCCAALRDEGKVMLVSTHNLGSVPDFCDRTVLINKTILASGFTKDIFTPENLKIAFGGVLRHFILGGKDLHHDDDQRQVNVLSDHKRPIVMYGNS